MASKYSDHKESASRGGELNWFGTGEIISDFAEAAFKLKKDGDYSQPVRTVYGWHIIKRLERKGPGTYEEMRSWLESRINESYLNSISKKSFVEKLKKEYKYTLNNNIVSWFISNTDTMIIKGLSKYDRSNLPQGTIYTFANQQLTSGDFANYIEKRGSIINTNDPAIFISRSVETCLADQINSYENSNLEKKYPEFRYLMNEFHDGILLFELSGRKVWNKSQDDSTGLRKYYDENKGKFLTKEKIEGKIYILNRKGGMKKLVAAYDKYAGTPDADKKLTDKFNSRGDTLLRIKNGTWHRGDDKIIDGIKWEPGVYKTEYGEMPAIIVFTNLHPPEPMPFSEVRADMISGYQDWLEKEWIRQLKEKYPVKIDKIVFEEIRKKLTNG
jgi:peptidyl-prolyl cis-trans isomerase SurA